MATVKQATIKNTRELLETDKETGTVMTLGNIIAMTGGYAVDADSGTVVADLLGICNQTISAADALLRVLYIAVADTDTFIISVANTSNARHNGQAMVLSNATTANNTGTTSGTGIVQQVEVYGETSDKLIVARFLTL